MKRTVALFLALSLFSHCRKEVPIVCGVDYFQQHGLQRLPVTFLSGEDASVRLKGVYLPADRAVPQPVLLFLHQGRLCAALLRSALPCEAGDYVYVQGALELDRQEHSAALLTVDSLRVLHRGAKLLQKAAVDFARAKESLKKSCGCNVESLSFHDPKFLMVIDEERSRSIVFFSHADVLCHLRIDGEYSFPHGQLQRLYVDCRFKGE